MQRFFAGQDDPLATGPLLSGDEEKALASANEALDDFLKANRYLTHLFARTQTDVNGDEQNDRAVGPGREREPKRPRHEQQQRGGDQHGHRSPAEELDRTGGEVAVGEGTAMAVDDRVRAAGGTSA